MVFNNLAQKRNKQMISFNIRLMFFRSQKTRVQFLLRYQFKNQNFFRKRYGKTLKYQLIEKIITFW